MKIELKGEARRSVRTYSCVSFLADDHDALDEGGACVVDAVEHRLLVNCQHGCQVS